jgi:hypothetical protein
MFCHAVYVEDYHKLIQTQFFNPVSRRQSDVRVDKNVVKFAIRKLLKDASNLRRGRD